MGEITAGLIVDGVFAPVPALQLQVSWECKQAEDLKNGNMIVVVIKVVMKLVVKVVVNVVLAELRVVKIM